MRCRRATFLVKHCENRQASKTTEEGADAQPQEDNRLGAGDGRGFVVLGAAGVEILRRLEVEQIVGHSASGRCDPKRAGGSGSGGRRQRPTAQAQDRLGSTAQADRKRRADGLGQIARGSARSLRHDTVRGTDHCGAAHSAKQRWRRSRTDDSGDADRSDAGSAGPGVARNVCFLAHAARHD